MKPLPDTYYMQQALAEARAAARQGEVPVGAVMVCNHRIIARAYNRTQALNDATAHAEMLVLTAAMGMLGAKYLVDCTLYVTIEPCVMCAGAIGWAQVGTVVYGAPDDKKGYRKYAPLAMQPKTQVRSDVLRDECTAQMQAFFKKRR